MNPRNAPWTYLILGLALGCAPDRDKPVPAEEPRAEVAYRLDLPRVDGCELDFDLAVYKHRGVDLIRWDSAEAGCSGRGVVIRYLPRRIAIADVEALVRAHATRAERMEAR